MPDNYSTEGFSVLKYQVCSRIGDLANICILEVNSASLICLKTSRPNIISDCLLFISCNLIIPTFHTRMEGNICVGEWAVKGKYGKLTSNERG